MYANTDPVHRESWELEVFEAVISLRYCGSAKDNLEGSLLLLVLFFSS